MHSANTLNIRNTIARFRTLGGCGSINAISAIASSGDGVGTGSGSRAESGATPSGRHTDQPAVGDPVLRLDHVSRSFSRGNGRHQAVRGISLTVDAGRIVCLLGPNGAGKTTTMKMIATLLTPDGGSISVCGVDAVRRPRDARRHLSLLLGGDRGFYLRVSAIENLRYFAQLAGVPSSVRETRIAEALDWVGLADVANNRVETFSRGMTQRLHIARAMLNHAPLLLLDEPTNGLDPENAHAVRTLVSRLRGQGTGILLTTHALAEAEALADRTDIIDGGRIIASGTTADLSEAMDIDGVTMWTAESFGERDRERLNRLDGVRYVDANERNGLWTVNVAWSHREPELPGAGVARLGIRAATLEETYLALLEARHERESAAGGFDGDIGDGKAR